MKTISDYANFFTFGLRVIKNKQTDKQTKPIRNIACLQLTYLNFLIVLGQIKAAEILIADPPYVAPYIHNLPNLQWLHLTFAGVEMIAPHFQDKTDPPPYIITRMAGTYAIPMAEFVLGYIIAYERKFKHAWEKQKQHVW